MTAVYSALDGELLYEIPTLNFRGNETILDPPAQDLNGDSLVDMVVWSQDANGKPTQVQAHSGQDGSPIWLQPAVLNPSRVTWPPSAVDDLNGDGRPEVITVFQLMEPGIGVSNKLACLNGKDGLLRWEFSWDGLWSDLLPPQVVNFKGNGQRSVCLGIRDRSGFQLVILDADGVETGRGFLGKAYESDLRQGLRCWKKTDLIGDGREELLFVTKGKLCAIQGDQDQFLWQLEMPNNQASIITTVNHGDAFRSADGQLARLAMWSGTTVYGLSGSTGQVLWRCPAPSFCNDPDQVEIMAVSDRETPPRIFFGECGECRQALAVTPTGKYLALKPLPIERRAVPELVPPRRDMPWRPHSNYRENIGTVIWFELIRPLIALAVVIIPALLFYRAARYRKWSYAIWATLYTLITGTSYVLFGIYVEGPGDLEALAGLPTAIAVSMFALVAARGNRRWIAWFLISTLTVTVVLGTVWLISDSFVKPEWQKYSWNAWFWLISEGVSATGVLIFVAFPICIVVYFSRAFRRRLRQSIP